MTTKPEEEQLTVNIPKDLMKAFRKRAREEYGDKRGYIKEAVTAALKEWTEKDD